MGFGLDWDGIGVVSIPGASWDRVGVFWDGIWVFQVGPLPMPSPVPPTLLAGGRM